ncbi:MAG: acyl-CoA dehydrogenase [Gammaproteobacteria bacterium]|jgi:alkylation response protein AidB-like acyl-CoA dehydrogenase|nr:MAG: acyl-CoA dehydrogenase [Gammaproteobacteria bacterium]
MTQPRDYGFDEETGMLKDAAARFFDEKEMVVRLRPHLKGTEDPHRGSDRAPWYDEASWQEMQELGWHLLAVPESAGGIGMGLVAAVAIQEEIGRAACPTPLTGTLQATFLLREASLLGGAGADQALAKIAEGTSVALGIFGEAGSPELDATAIRAEGNRLTGTSWYVQDAGKVDAFVIAARSDAGIGLYFVPRDAVTVEQDRIVDLSRDQGRVVLDGAEAEVIAEPGEGEAVLARALPAILTLIAADMAGAAEWQLQTTAEYAKVRMQFDRPIGFFQAVKHPIVNMMIAADETRSLVYNAACAYDHEPEDALRCALMAKSSASDTASFCSNRSTQLHGGIGFTWEADVQIYHKRQMHNQFLFGDGTWQRQRLAELL